MRRMQIAVIGYDANRCSEAARSLAYETGRQIAKAGAVLVCGGLEGVIVAGGTTIGIIPQDEF